MKGKSTQGLATAITLVAVVFAAIASHLLGSSDPYLDALGLTAFGILAGTSGAITQLNGTVKKTERQDAEIQQLRAQLNEMKAKEGTA